MKHENRSRRIWFAFLINFCETRKKKKKGRQLITTLFAAVQGSVLPQGVLALRSQVRFLFNLCFFSFFCRSFPFFVFLFLSFLLSSFPGVRTGIRNT